MKRASDCGLFLLYRAYRAKFSFWNKNGQKQIIHRYHVIQFTNSELQMGILFFHHQSGIDPDQTREQTLIMTGEKEHYPNTPIRLEILYYVDETSDIDECLCLRRCNFTDE